MREKTDEIYKGIALIRVLLEHYLKNFMIKFCDIKFEHQ